MTVEMFQPVACDARTGQIVPLAEPTLDREHAEERVADFDSSLALAAEMSGIATGCRGGVMEGYFITYRISYPDGTSEDLRVPAEPANGHGPVEAPEPAPAPVLTVVGGI